jgi:hypothetical protein
VVVSSGLRVAVLTQGAWPAAARLEGGGAVMAGGWGSPCLALGLGGDGWPLAASVPTAA